MAADPLKPGTMSEWTTLKYFECEKAPETFFILQQNVHDLLNLTAYVKHPTKGTYHSDFTRNDCKFPGALLVMGWRHIEHVIQNNVGGILC